MLQEYFAAVRAAVGRLLLKTSGGAGSEPDTSIFREFSKRRNIQSGPSAVRPMQGLVAAGGIFDYTVDERDLSDYWKQTR
jgi:hypothetical protein